MYRFAPFSVHGVIAGGHSPGQKVPCRYQGGVNRRKRQAGVTADTDPGFSDVALTPPISSLELEAFTSIQRECWVFLLLVQDAAVHH